MNTMHPLRTLTLAVLCLMLCAGLALHTPSAQAAQSHSYMGNPKSGIYHNSQCKYFSCKACTVPLASREEAKAKGFRPCKVCGG